MREHCEHNAICFFTHDLTLRALNEHRRLAPADSHLGKHKTHMHLPATSVYHVICHTHLHLVLQLLSDFITRLTNPSDSCFHKQTSGLLMEMCHTYCTVYISNI